MTLTETALVNDWGDRLYETKAIEAILPVPEVAHASSLRPKDAHSGKSGKSNHVNPLAGLLNCPALPADSTGTVHVHTIFWRVEGDVIVLEPVDLNGSEKGLVALRLQCPASVFNSCVVLGDYKGEFFVLDFVSETGFLYTVQLPYDQFLGKGISLNDNGASWRSIKRPYAFDLIHPLVLSTAPHHSLLVSLTDGSLVHFERSAPLANISSVQLSDQFSLSGLARLLKGSSEKVPGTANLTTRAIVAIDTFDDLVVTQCVDSTLKLWSISKKCAIEQITSSSDKSPALFKLAPSRFVAIDSRGEHVLAYVPKDGKPCFKIFALWDPNGPKAHLEDLGAQFDAEVPSEVASWYLADFLFFSSSTEFKIIAAWKSNLRSLVASIGVSRNEAGDVPINTSVISRQDAGVALSIPDEEDIAKFANHVINSGKYSSRTIRQAMPVYCPGTPLDESNAALKDLVTEVVEKTARSASDDSQRNLRLQWMRLDRLCREIEGQAKEILALGFVPRENIIWSVRRSYLSLIGEASHLDVIEHLVASNDKSEQSPSQALLAAIRLLYAGLPRSVTSQFETAIMKDVSEMPTELLFDRMGNIYKDILRPSLGDLRALRHAVAKLESVETTVNELLAECFPDRKDSDDLAHKDSVTPLGAEALSRLVYNYAGNAANLTTRLLLFVLVSYAEGWLSDGVGIYSNVLRFFKRSHAIIALKEPMSNEDTGCACNPRTSALEVCTSSLGLHISGPDLGSLAVTLWHLLDFGQSSSHGPMLLMKLIEDKFNPKSLINATRYLSHDAEGTFITACAYLSVPQYAVQGERLARQVAIPLSQNQFPRLSFVGQGVGRGLESYYSMVSSLCESLGQEDAALGFARLAAENGPVEAQRQLLRLSLASRDLLSGYEAICMLQRSGVDIELDIERFIEMAVQQDGTEFVCRELPFIGISDIVTKVLSSRSYVGGIPSYKLLYTWCVNREDYTGAATCIYKYILSVQICDSSSGLADTEVAELFDLYTIVLNVLRLTAAPDRVVLVQGNVYSYDDIRKDYEKLSLRMAGQIAAAV